MLGIETENLALTQSENPPGAFFVLLTAMVRRWMFIGLCAGLGLLIGFTAALSARRIYTASVEIVPVGSGPEVGPNLALGSVAGALSGLGIQMPRGENSSDFILFPKVLVSSEVAKTVLARPDYLKRIFPGEYNPATGRFEPRPGLAHSLRVAFWSLFGEPAYFPPSVNRVQSFISTHVGVVQATTTSPITTLVFSDEDPAFAKSFLGFLVQATDAQLRTFRLKRAQDSSSYLENKLNSVSALDYRAGLINQLLPQQMTVMMSDPHTAFSARVIDGPSTADRPDSQPVFTILAGFALGLIAGAGLIALGLFFPEIPNPVRYWDRRMGTS